MHCLILNRGALYDSAHSQKEHTELCKTFNYGVDQANIEQDTTNYVLEFLLRDVWIPGYNVRASMCFLLLFGVFEWLYVVCYRDDKH